MADLRCDDADYWVNYERTESLQSLWYIAIYTKIKDTFPDSYEKVHKYACTFGIGCDKEQAMGIHHHAHGTEMSRTMGSMVLIRWPFMS